MNPRKLALEVLGKIHAGGQYSNIAVDNALGSAQLNENDRGLFTALVMGVVERQITLDYVINTLAEQPDKIETNTRLLLRLGLYQLMFFDRIPEYAAINETVDLCPRRTKGFVNAVLRSYLRKKDSIPYPDKEKEPIKHLCVKYSFPEELCERFAEQFGYERTCAIFERYNMTPPLTIRVNTLRISRDEYALLLDGVGLKYELTQNAPNGIKIFGASYSSLPGSDEGLFFVQDEASQICVEAMGAKVGDFVIDSCSCPGSKSFGAAINMQSTGKILSCDLHDSKLSLIERGAERLGIDIISVRRADARIFDENLYMSADVLLCDAPCSGFGVVAKKPEIRYKDISQTDRLPQIQADILDNVCKYVKVGGVLIYSTCTVFDCENEDMVRQFLDKHPEYVAEDFCVGNISSENGMLRLSPDIHGTDGFFVSKMRRINREN